MLNDTAGGIGEDLHLSPSGDYCSYYGVGDNLTLQTSGNQGSATGYTPPEPFSSYQEGDANGSVCQADGSHWGQEVRSGVSGNLCKTGTCGMHHWVSLASQGTNDRPWSESFGEPSLVISAEAGVQTFSPSGVNYGGWGYVCAELEDTSFHGVLEYCLQEWRSAHNDSEWKTERVGECNSPWSMVNTYFSPGTQYATEMPGSTNTVEVGSSGFWHFEAKITQSNLLGAIKLVNSKCAGWHLSENPANYSLVGAEQGLEGWEMSEIAGSAANLQLRTESTQQSPEAVTTAASSISPEDATLNGEVNPEHLATKYYFEYGATTSYGNTIPAGGGNLGNGDSMIPCYDTVAGLVPGTQYHYRIVAENYEGRSYGSDHIFTTPGPVEAVSDKATNLFEIQATLNGTVNPRGYGATYFFQYGTSTSYGWSTPESSAGNGVTPVSETAIVNGLQAGITYHYRLVAKSGALTSYGQDETFTLYEEDSSRSALRDPSTGYMWDYYPNESSSLWYWSSNGMEWFDNDIGGEVASGTNPVAIHDPTTGWQWVFYVGKESSIRYWWWSNTEWVSTKIGGEVAPGTSPSVLFDPNTGYLWVYYVGKEGSIWYWAWDGTEWINKKIGGEVAPGTSPTVVHDPNSGYQWVYYVGKESAVRYWGWTGTEWINTKLGGEVAPESNPTVLRDPNTKYQWVYYIGKEDAIWYWGWTGTEWINTKIGGEVAPTSSPTAARDPNSGYQWVYYVGKEDAIWYWGWTGTEWINTKIGGEVAQNTSPTVVLAPSTPAIQWVYYVGKEDAIWYWVWNGEWDQNRLGGETS